MKILLVADMRHWALGSVARLMGAGLARCDVDIVYFRELTDADALLDHLFHGEYDIVHFFNRFNLVELNDGLNGRHQWAHKRCRLTISVPDHLGLGHGQQDISRHLLSIVDGVVFSNSDIHDVWHDRFHIPCPSATIHDVFHAQLHTIAQRHHHIEQKKNDTPFRVCWVGNSAWAGGRHDHKGYHQIWKAITSQLAGADIVFTEFDKAQGGAPHDAVLKTLSSAHLLCMTSASEGTALPALEAIGAGAGLLSTRSGVLHASTRQIFPQSFCRRHPRDFIRKIMQLQSDRDQWCWQAKAQSTLVPESWNQQAFAQWADFFHDTRKTSTQPRAHGPRSTGGCDVLKPVLCITTSRWPGVRHSSQTIFPNRIALPYCGAQAGKLKNADRLNAHLDSKNPIVISGGDDAHRDFYARYMQHHTPSCRQLSVLWHGSLTQLSSPGHMRDFSFWYELAKQGRIYGIAALKRDMFEFLKAQNINSFLMQNTFAFDTSLFGADQGRADVTQNEPLTIGFPSSTLDFNKNLATQLLSLALLGERRCRALLTHSAQAEQLCSTGGLTDICWVPANLDQTEFIRRYEQADINCAVTFSECSPMVPLESAMNLTPCIVGPASDVYQGFALLQKHCVVTRPDDAVEIAQKIREVAQHYRAIQQQLMEWRHRQQHKRLFYGHDYAQWLFAPVCADPDDHS